MNMEIQFLHENFAGKDPKLLANHIRRLGSGGAQLFPTTLSLVFDMLIEKTVPPPVPPRSGLGKSFEIQETAVHTTPPRASTSTFPTSASPFPYPYPSLAESASWSRLASLPRLASQPVPPNNQHPLTWLVCSKCGQRAFSVEL